MIQSADVGVGIVGKEGMQAALAADFSIKEFKDLKVLLFWHGRLSYKRSSLLASFIIHRGFIISVIQMIFSCTFYLVSIPVFNSYLQLGYATIFTFWPVFALILDKDVNVKVA
jgi:phospholipid-translocating ATPase